MKSIYLFVCVLMFSCDSGQEEVSHTMKNKERQRVQAREQEIIYINSILDDEDPEGGDFLDALENKAVLENEFDLEQNKLKQYEQVVPANSTALKKFAAIVNSKVISDERFSRATDSIIINTVSDSLVSRKLILIDKLLKKAQYLFDTSNFNTMDTADGRVIRRGIKYAWGSKDFRKKYNPAVYTAGTSKPSSCDYNITGLDCSGFLYQLFKLVNPKIKIPSGNANLQRKTSSLKSALNSYFDNSARFTVKDFGELPPSKIESGDIIYFYTKDTIAFEVKATHIGIVLKPKKATIKFFHSSGGRQNCIGNISYNGGIRCVDIFKYLISNSKKRSYGVVRLIVEPELE